MARTFGGASSDRVTTSGSDLNDLTTFTYLVWCYCTTRTSTRCLMGKGPARNRFRLNGGSGNIELLVSRTSNTSYITNDTPLATNTWTCVATTFDTGGGAGNIVHIYTGTLTSSMVESTYGTTTDGSGSLLGDSGAGLEVGNCNSISVAFQGRIAVAMVFNRVLTLAELKSLQYRPRVLSGCVLYYQLGYGDSADVDLSGKGHVGTVSGPTQSAHVPLRAPFSSTTTSFITFAGGSGASVTAGTAELILESASVSSTSGVTFTAPSAEMQLQGATASASTDTIASAGASQLTLEAALSTATVSSLIVANASSLLLEGAAATITAGASFTTNAGQLLIQASTAIADDGNIPISTITGPSRLRMGLGLGL